MMDRHRDGCIHRQAKSICSTHFKKLEMYIIRKDSSKISLGHETSNILPCYI